MGHNVIIKKQMVEDEVKRWKFLSSHKDLIKPFVNEKVLARLNIKADLDSIDNKENQIRDIVSVQPESIDPETTTMRDYQMIGLNWMMNMHEKGLGMILGDEMGLGKTLQTISLLAYLKEHSKEKAPSLVICPLSVLYSWCNEIEKHAGDSLTYFRLHSSGVKERESQINTIKKDILNYDVIITTYEMAKSQKMSLIMRSVYFRYVVLDEGHIIKAADTQISLAVRKFHSRNKLILTGTPLQNNLVELQSILNYLYPDVFTEDKYFRDAFDIGQNKINKDMLLKANKLLNMFMLRRLKAEVEKLMPKKIETKILCPLSASQIFWYKGYLMKDIDLLVRASEDYDVNSATSRYQVLKNLVMQLRKCCLHPFLFDGAETSIEDTSLEELISASGKLSVLDKMLRSLFQNGNRTVIFSQFTSMLDILEDYCVMRGWKYCRFDGGTPRAQRNYLINQFSKPGSDIFIFLMCTRSGGLGINLQTADTCILYDSDWNPQPDLQAMARVHRIGQKKIVHIYRLVSSGTVEERVLQRAEKKLYLDQMVNRGTTNQTTDMDGSGLTTAELLSTLKFGSNAIFKSDNDLPTDEDIAAMTDRNRSEETSFGVLKGGVANTANDFEADKELTDTQTFEGIDFRKIRDIQKKNPKHKHKNITKLKEEWSYLNSFNNDDGGRGKRQKTERILELKGNDGVSRQVLSINNYDLMDGEPSVFEKETRKTAGMSNPKKKVKKKGYVHQDFCQFCGYSGTLVLCNRCPIAVHPTCCGLSKRDLKSTYTCSHHHCIGCGKDQGAAGGLLFVCQSCPGAFCEDCKPTKVMRYLGSNLERFEELGFEGKPHIVYIHCSEQCENVAIQDLGWKVPPKMKTECPPVIDVSYAYGSKSMSIQDIAKKRELEKSCARTAHQISSEIALSPPPEIKEEKMNESVLMSSRKRPVEVMSMD